MPVGASAQGLRSAGFSPDQIGSLAHWYDATKLSGFSDGNSVGTWPDEEGGDDLTQGTGSAQPTYQTNIINGEPVVRHDGTDDTLQGAFGSTLSTPVHIFAVAADLTGVDDAQSSFWDGGTQDEARFFGDDNTNSNTWTMYAGTRLQGGTEDTNAHIFGCLYNGASSVLREDGTQLASGDPGSSSVSGFTTGARGDISLFGNVDIGEVLIYDASLSTADRDSVESYLSDKWGIAI